MSRVPELRWRPSEHQATVCATRSATVGTRETGEDLSTVESAESMAKVVGCHGEVCCDPSKPDGSPHRLPCEGSSPCDVRVVP
jgi:hypothetical protein